MTLIPVETAEDFSLAEQFVIPHEETCVSLASLVRRKSDNLVFILNTENPVVEEQNQEDNPKTTLSARFLTDSQSDKVSIRPSDYSTTDTSTNSPVVEWPRSDCIETTGILGILNLDSTIYHCIPNPALINADELSENLNYLIKKQIRCISGEKKATDFLIEVCNSVRCGFDPSTGLRDRMSSGLLNHPAQVYDYKMLRWLSTSEAGVSKPPKSQMVSTLRQGSGTASSTTLSGGEEIIRCTEHDMEILHPLQKDYMKDEVAVPGRPITDAEVDISLRQILKNQLCFALTVDGDIVAKANTNAIGINKVQIGGVYTHPLYRRNGYAAALVTALCNRALRSGKEPVLFVKEKNMPAFSLYQKIGFAECGQYSIAYY